MKTCGSDSSLVYVNVNDRFSSAVTKISITDVLTG